MTIILIICSSFQETKKVERNTWKTKTHLKAAFLGKTHEIDVYIVHFSSSYHMDVCVSADVKADEFFATCFGAELSIEPGCVHHRWIL